MAHDAFIHNNNNNNNNRVRVRRNGIEFAQKHNFRFECSSVWMPWTRSATLFSLFFRRSFYFAGRDIHVFK